MPQPTAAAEHILDRRNLYMLPTRHGLLFAAVLMVMLLAAVNYNNGLAYGFTFLLAGLACVSMFHTHRNLSGLSISVGAPAPVFAGQTMRFPVTCQNLAGWPRTNIWLLAAGHQQLVELPAGATLRVELPQRSNVRGVVAAPDLRLSSAFPLGLLYSWSGPLRGEAMGLVYPQPGPPAPLPETSAVRHRDAQGRQAEGDDFVGLRDYRLGDPPHHVHWKASAHNQTLQTKVFGGQNHSRIWLDWQHTGGSVEQRLGQLCRWVIDAEAAHISYGLRLPGKRIEPNRGPAHRHETLKALALWNPPDEI